MCHLRSLNTVLHQSFFEALTYLDFFCRNTACCGSLDYHCNGTLLPACSWGTTVTTSPSATTTDRLRLWFHGISKIVLYNRCAAHCFGSELHARSKWWQQSKSKPLQLSNRQYLNRPRYFLQIFLLLCTDGFASFHRPLAFQLIHSSAYYCTYISFESQLQTA